MDELFAFVRAQLDRREQAALAASPGPWKTNAEHDEILAIDDITVADGFALSGSQLRATVDHIVLNDPVSVLAEVEAKRRILDIHHHIECQHDNYGPGGDCAECGNEYPCETVRLLAQAYAGQPGWREEWRS